jgi:competence protein ComEA
MPHIPRSQLVAYAVIAVAVLVLGGRWLAGRASGGEQIAAATSLPAAPRERSPDVRLTPGSRSAFVHVVGAVRRPGVYRLGGGARVQDALRRAGGATRRANVDAINLAAPVQDGAQIVVPRRGAVGAVAAPAGTDGATPGAGAVPAAPVNLNAATAEQLETLDGVGPATAAKILDYRRTHGGFRSVDDLDEVSGIGPKRLAALRGKVTV